MEYRGYDSAGVSVIADGSIDSVRAVGNLANLREAMTEHVESTRALTQSLADTRIVLTDEAGAVLGAAEAGSRAVCAL